MGSDLLEVALRDNLTGRWSSDGGDRRDLRTQSFAAEQTTTLEEPRTMSQLRYGPQASWETLL